MVTWTQLDFASDREEPLPELPAKRPAFFAFFPTFPILPILSYPYSFLFFSIL